tara:strand:- start:144 stop:662 length:519 start_codon:yes stop_codon:yes gene_type:complete
MKKIPLTDKDVVEGLCNTATNVCNLQEGVLKNPTRLRKVHLPRMVVSNICHFEKGIHYNTIAEVLKRHRCSIYHYKKHHEIYYSHWKDYRRLYNNIYDAYIDNKKLDLKDVDIKDYLKAANIYDRQDPKVFIDVKVKDASVRVKSTYKHFTKDVENIKRALKDYVHDIYIEL